MPAPAASVPFLLLGAYYYTWYGIGEQWQVFPRTFEPTLGEYKSAEPAIMAKHHEWAKQANIDFFAVSWGGDGTRFAPSHEKERAGSCRLTDKDGSHIFPRCTSKDGSGEGDPENKGIYDVDGWDAAMLFWKPSGDIDKLIQQHLDVPGAIPMALMYEVRDVLGVGEGQGSVDLSWGANPQILEHHLLYAADKLFLHPNYLRINGSPVLFLYTLRDFKNFVVPLKNAFDKVSERIGAPLYIIGDMIWWSPSPQDFPWDAYQRINVSAVTAYNLYNWGNPGKMGDSYPFHCANLYSRIADQASKHGIQVLPYVSPGYDDRKMRGGDRPPVSRSDGAGYLFSWLQMRWFTKCQPKVTGKQPIMMINSFNEWHEGTQIEPSVEHSDSYIHWTREIRRALGFEASGEGESKVLSSFQCHDDEKGPWSDAGYDESVTASGLNLLKHHHWSAEVRGSPDGHRSGNSASFWKLPDGFNSLGVLASVWPMAGLLIWAISNRVGGNTFFMVTILIIGIAFAISNMIASGVAHEDDEEFELGALAPMHHALVKTYAAISGAAHKQGQMVGCDGRKLGNINGWNERAARGPFAIGCMPSKEREAVKQLYRDILGREADPGGLDHYAKEYGKGGNRKHVVEQLWGSDEGKGYNTRRMDSFFRDSGMERNQVAEVAFESVRKAYIMCLGRDFDDGGLKAYIDNLLGDRSTPEAICEEMRDSEEGKLLWQNR